MKALSKNIKNLAINLMFSDESLSQEKREKLEAYIDRQFEICHCVVMHYSDFQRSLKRNLRATFPKLCDSLNLDPQKREIIITEAGSILFSENYRYYPEAL